MLLALMARSINKNSKFKKKNYSYIYKIKACLRARKKTLMLFDTKFLTGRASAQNIVALWQTQ